jgi:hypothetical protein
MSDMHRWIGGVRYVPAKEANELRARVEQLWREFRDLHRATAGAECRAIALTSCQCGLLQRVFRHVTAEVK